MAQEFKFVSPVFKFLFPPSITFMTVPHIRILLADVGIDAKHRPLARRQA